MIDIASFIFGALMGAAWAWYLYDAFARPKVIKIEVNREVASQLSQEMVSQWLTSHGLMWMPMGKEFKCPEVKR